MDQDEYKKVAEVVEGIGQTNLKKGDTWYLIASRWYKQLRVFLNLNPDSGGGNVKLDSISIEEINSTLHPGPVDNSSILLEDGENIREHMIEALDYQIVPEETWEVLYQVFGITQGQKPIKRQVIEHGMFVKHCKVEVYFLELLLTQEGEPDTIKKAKFSKADKLSMLLDKAKMLFSIPPESTGRLWVIFGGNNDNCDLVTVMDQTLQDAGIFNNQKIVLDIQSPDGSWKRSNKSVDMENGTKERPSRDITPVSTSASTSSTTITNNINSSVGSTLSAPISTRYNYGSYSDAGHTERAQPGLCGLSNLGNTCFMNSIIQGLSNCPPITEYFANDNYIEDINEDNPLGMKGEIARAFGELVKSMWSGKYSYFVPRNFKMAVGRFAPQFSGYQQQDSQELLTFLLDGLHEDLNRIKKKPYIEMKDSDNRPDEEVATEAWENYKKRNDSVILDLFHGLLKSTVVCPECPKISVTFDPFCYLSLPLPVKKERRLEIFLVYLDPTKCPTQYRVTVAKNGCMKELCVALSQLSGVESSKMIVTDVYNHKFHKIYGPEDSISSILDRDDIFVYEVPTTDENDPNTMIIPVYMRERKSAESFAPFNLFGQPFFIGVPKKKITYDDLYQCTLKNLSRYVKTSTDVEWWKPQHNGINHSNNKNSNNNFEDKINNSSEETTPSSDCLSSSSMSETNEDETMYDEDDENKGPPKFFEINLVNSYGNAYLEPLKNDGSPLKITSNNYLSLDWHPKAKGMFYVEKEAENFAQDSSLETKQPQKKVVRLEECLGLYTTKEKLGEDDAWYCPKCQKHQQATKKFDIWSLPALLVISLKRFSYTRYWRDKLDTSVEFPVNGLDMEPYIINPNHGKAVYDLVAVSNHYGGMGGGHYTAFAKNKDDNRWYYFDDSSVNPSSEDSVVSKAAYVLFYQRRDLSEQLRKDVADHVADHVSKVCNGVNGEASAEEAMDIY